MKRGDRDGRDVGRKGMGGGKGGRGLKNCLPTAITE